MTVGCPNYLNATTTCDKALMYWRKGNHPSICAKIDHITTTMNKEKWNNYIVHVPLWL